jgi:hypothetical protein
MVLDCGIGMSKEEGRGPRLLISNPIPLAALIQQLPRMMNVPGATNNWVEEEDLIGWLIRKC